MRVVLIFFIAILFHFVAFAQQKKDYIVKAGEIPAEVLPAEAIYVFPAFTQGIVYMRDGSASTSKLNYNVMLSEMQFISDKGDTLSIAYPGTIKSIKIDTAVYFYDKNYLQVVSQIDSFKIAVKQSLVQLPYRTRGGYDAPTAAASITTFNSMVVGSGVANLQVKKDVRFEKDISYFIGDQYNHFFKADKKSFLNIFAIKENSILNYINENKIDYSKRADLEKFLKFCVNGQ